MAGRGRGRAAPPKTESQGKAPGPRAASAREIQRPQPQPAKPSPAPGGASASGVQSPPHPQGKPPGPQPANVCATQGPQPQAATPSGAQTVPSTSGVRSPLPAQTVPSTSGVRSPPPAQAVPSTSGVRSPPPVAPGPRPTADVSELRPPRRPGLGTEGKPIKLLANHFPIKIKERDTIYHYDVTVKNEKGKDVVNRKLLRKVLLDLSTKHHRQELYPYAPVFDGRKNLFTAKELPFFEREYRIEFVDADRERPSTFSVMLKFASRISLSPSINAYLKNGSTSNIPQDAIQALDTVLKYSLSNRFVPVGRTLVSEKFEDPYDIGGGSHLWFGHFQSLRLGWKPFINIDATQRAFLKPISIPDFFWEILGGDVNGRDNRRANEAFYNPNRRHLDDLVHKIRGIKVRYQRGPMKLSYRVNGIGKPPSQEMFEHNGKKISVKDYLSQQYRVQLRPDYAHLPCLWVGSLERRVYVPMELCTIEAGQPNNKKLTDTQTSNTIRAAAVKPNERRKRIVRSFNESLNLSEDYYAQQYGVTCEGQMVAINGRVLPAPMLQYGGNVTICPENGVWDMRNKRFLTGGTLTAWGIINLDCVQDGAAKKFAATLVRIGHEVGISIKEPRFIQWCNYQKMEETFREVIAKNAGLQLVFFIISRKGDPVYKEIKRVGDLDLNITTQCVQSKNVEKCDPATLSNICLKLNAKLGGENNFIHKNGRPTFFNAPYMIMGADVTHPSADQRQEGIPSVAAVVASLNRTATQYAAEIRLQEPRKEALQDLEEVTRKMLLNFYRKNNSYKPQRIIFYRDGVSEGQFQQVLREELTAVRAACTKLERDYKPAITFLVVQKRNKTRLFAQESKDAGRTGNVPPGTIVDTDITHPTEQDYFLVSHVGIQGTSRPTHYHVLWDDNNFSADDMQKMTYYLCHIFSRCTRSVSNPAPSYYAHLLAFRGRMYYDSLVTQQRGRVREEDIKRELSKASNLQHMFFV